MLNVNTPKNLSELRDLLLKITPAGCYADLAGQAVWVEDDVVVAVPHGDSLEHIIEWDDFDETQGSDIVEVIGEWLESPRFGVITSIPTTTIEKPIAEQNNYENAFLETFKMLDLIVNGSNFEYETHAKDCLGVFDEYDWQMKAGVDAVRYQELLDKGNANDMKVSELTEFLNLASLSGEYHYLLLYVHGAATIRKYSKLYLKDIN